MANAEPVQDSLAEELAAYAAHKQELLGTAKGKFVLVHDSQVVNVYENERDAINEGYRLFGNVPFLVKQVVEVEIPERFVSNHLAV